MLPHRNEETISKVFTFLWQIGVAYGIFWIMREVSYISALIANYMQVLLQSGVL